MSYPRMARIRQRLDARMVEDVAVEVRRELERIGVLSVVRDAETVAVRVPEWTERGAVVCKVNDRPRNVTWSGGYVELNSLNPGDAVTVEFPMTTKTLFRVIGDIPYRLRIRGSTVVDIGPKGKVIPLYQRERYECDEAPAKKVARFVSGEQVYW